MAKKRVFVSYDVDNDKFLKESITSQAKNPDSPFEVSDVSVKEEAPQAEWETRTRAAIARADIFLVMLGSKTRQAPGVRKEVRMANAFAKTRFQIIGYENDGEDWAVPNAGPVYKWSWPNLKNVLK
jgi:hypothetical protein